MQLSTLPPTLRSLRVKITPREEHFTSVTLGPPSASARYRRPHSLPLDTDLAAFCPNLETLEMFVDDSPSGAFFSKSIFNLTALKSLSVFMLSADHLHLLPGSLTYLKVAHLDILKDQEVQFPALLDTLKIRSPLLLKHVISLPKQLRTLKCTIDWNGLLKLLAIGQVLPPGLTCLQTYYVTSSLPMDYDSPMTLTFPASLDTLVITCSIHSVVVRSLPKTMKTLWFSQFGSESVMWSDMPPLITDVQLLSNFGPTESFPRHLKRFRLPGFHSSNWPDVYLYGIDYDTDPKMLPRTLEDMSINIPPPRDDKELVPLDIPTTLGSLPPALTHLHLESWKVILSPSGLKTLFNAIDSLHHLRKLAIAAHIFIEAFMDLKAPLVELELFSDVNKPKGLLNFRRMVCKEDSLIADSRSLLSSSVNLSQSHVPYPWSSRLEKLAYGSEEALTPSWASTLPSNLKSLVMRPSNHSPFPASCETLVGLPRHLTYLIITVASLPPGILPSLPRTLRTLSLSVPQSVACSYDWEELLALPRRLQQLFLPRTNARSPMLTKNPRQLFQEQRPQCKLVWLS